MRVFKSESNKLDVYILYKKKSLSSEKVLIGNCNICIQTLFASYVLTSSHKKRKHPITCSFRLNHQLSHKYFRDFIRTFSTAFDILREKYTFLQIIGTYKKDQYIKALGTKNIRKYFKFS